MNRDEIKELVEKMSEVSAEVIEEERQEEAKEAIAALELYLMYQNDEEFRTTLNDYSFEQTYG